MKNNNKPTLTIFTPAYNRAYTLHLCYESLLRQKNKDFEWLIVDDGSTDGTAKIGKEYEKRYPQTYRVISKTNGGHGSTINCGIEQSRGTFFKVVDGDDWVNTEALIEVVRRLKTCGADYVVTDYCEVNDKTKEQVRKQFPALDVCREIRFENAAEKVQIPMHALIIRTDLLKTHQIRLDEHCFYVDVEYFLTAEIACGT